MTAIDKVLYTAKTHTTGGRDGSSRASDGRLDVKLSNPGAAGGGTNPEQLFAAGWSAYTTGLGAFTIGVFFMLAVMSTEVFGIILAGYGSGSKWALFGGMREAAQMVSYEVPMAICVLVPVIVAGSMDLNRIGLNQSGMLWNWYLFHDPFTFFAFWTYFTCATASVNRRRACIDRRSSTRG